MPKALNAFTITSLVDGWQYRDGTELLVAEHMGEMIAQAAVGTKGVLQEAIRRYGINNLHVEPIPYPMAAEALARWKGALERRPKKQKYQGPRRQLWRGVSHTVRG